MYMKRVHTNQELVATFMGLPRDEEYDAWLIQTDRKFLKGTDLTWADVRKSTIKKKNLRSKSYMSFYIFNTPHLRYNRSWKWLKPVVERLEFVTQKKISMKKLKKVGIRHAFHQIVSIIKTLNNGN